jgi:hypothetical protein
LADDVLQVVHVLVVEFFVIAVGVPRQAGMVAVGITRAVCKIGLASLSVGVWRVFFAK